MNSLYEKQSNNQFATVQAHAHLDREKIRFVGDAIGTLCVQEYLLTVCSANFMNCSGQKREVGFPGTNNGRLFKRIDPRSDLEWI
ncbi:MAG: hypothetical protein D4R77_04030 [Planctomycetaceae bacterium]|nr:MAG: hypothetical protein D4R77_04030 [Planctomycetaceae bacterium]